MLGTCEALKSDASEIAAFASQPLCINYQVISENPTIYIVLFSDPSRPTPRQRPLIESDDGPSTARRGAALLGPERAASNEQGIVDF